MVLVKWLFDYLIKHRLEFDGILLYMATETEVAQRAKIFAALADSTRLRFVELLAQSDEMSGSEVADKLGISLALMCHHSKVIVDVGLAKKRKDGQTAYFSLDKEVLSKCLSSFN
jgi:DNA-binding transcriptional ArsR family regulator